MLQLELVQAETTDGYTLHGLRSTPDGRPERASLLLVHGVGGNFYSGPLPLLAKELTAHGYECLTINTRGHDWISGGEPPKGFMGAAYELFEETLFDLDAFLQLLQDAGAKNLVLLGHSLGATKALYYQSSRPHSSIRSLIACSPADLSYEGRVKRIKGFEATYRQAKRSLAEGKADELYRVPSPTGWDSDTLFTARTLVNKYDRSTRFEASRLISNINTPILLTAGSKENTLLEHARKLSTHSRSTIEVIEGADHFYTGRHMGLAQVIDGWLSANLGS